jgi:hypothetical protein
MLLVICLRAILMTGDGSEEEPYVVCAASDELDLLDELDLTAASKSLVHRGDCTFDVVRCDDGSKVWFDASAMVQIPAEMPVISRPASNPPASQPDPSPAAGSVKLGGKRPVAADCLGSQAVLAVRQRSMAPSKNRPSVRTSITFTSSFLSAGHDSTGPAHNTCHRWKGSR